MNELPKYFGHIKIVEPHDKVYKNECACSFDTAESEHGLYICMKTFRAIGHDFLDYYFTRYGNAVYLQHKRLRYKLNKPESSEIKPKRLAIGLEGGFNPDAADKDFHVEDSYSIIILPERHQIPLPNPDLPELVLQSISSIMAAESDETKENCTSVWDGEQRQVSKFAESLEQHQPAPKIPPSNWKCEKCDLKENLWLNLTDGSILCGRRFFDGSGGNNHAVEHYELKKNPLAVKLGTITATGGDVYSYPEDDMVIDPHLDKHLAHFGIDIQKMTKTEKSMLELEIDMNEKLGEWSLIQEEGKSLELAYGPGFTGLVNLGNSCYMNSVLQVLMSIEDFQRYYYPPLPIYQKCEEGPSEFNHQMAKLAYGILSGNYSQRPEQADHAQAGIEPKSFKHFVCGHDRNFSTKRQQDAHEFLLFLIDLIERNCKKSNSDVRPGAETSTNEDLDEKSANDPTKCLEFVIEDRLECLQSGKVKYNHRVETCLPLQVDLDLAANKGELQEYKDKLEAKETPEIVRPLIPLMSCIELSARPEQLTDFYSSAISARTTAEKTSKISRFPQYFVFQMKKFQCGSDWVPKKMDVAIDAPDILDLELLEGNGLQPGEEELVDKPEKSQATPELGGGSSSGPPASSQVEPDSEAIVTLLSMGIDITQAIDALKICKNDAQRAIEYIFDPDSYNARQQQEENQSRLTVATRSDPLKIKLFSPDDRPKLYQLKAFISHMGTSTMCGHYVCHIKKDEQWYIYNDSKVAISENPPKEFGYLYFYERITGLI